MQTAGDGSIWIVFVWLLQSFGYDGFQKEIIFYIECDGLNLMFVFGLMFR